MDNEAREIRIPVVVEPDPRPLRPVPAAPAIIPDPLAWKKVRELALRQLNRFMAYEPKVLRGDDPDAIHDMRVASRRLQQVLDLLYPKPRPQELRKLRRQIRGCRQLLGDIRNCDVLLEHVDRSLARKRAARREAWTGVQQYLQARRSDCFHRATRKISKMNLAIFYVNLKEFLAREKTHEYVAERHHQATLADRPVFQKQLRQALHPLWDAFEDQVMLSHRDTRPAVIHGARLATKRLRYLLEVLYDFKVAGSADALAWLRQLQRQLGEWHDLEVLEQMMIEMLARPEFLRAHVPLAMEIEKLILRNRVNKVGFEEKYFRMSQESHEMRKLKEWVSYLLESPSALFAKA